MKLLARITVACLLLITAARPAQAQVQMGGEGSLTLDGVTYDFDVQICGEQVPGAYILNGTGETAEGQLFVVMVTRNTLKEGRVEESVTLNNPQANGASYFNDGEGWKRCTRFTLACKPGEGIPVEGPLLEFDGSTVNATGLFVGPDTGKEGQLGTVTATCGEAAADSESAGNSS
jgi:hypothetical protein